MGHVRITLSTLSGQPCPLVGRTNNIIVGLIWLTYISVPRLKCYAVDNTIPTQLCAPQIGVWYSWKQQGLEVKDIVWPGHSHVAPIGIPEKFHMKVSGRPSCVIFLCCIPHES